MDVLQRSKKDEMVVPEFAWKHTSTLFIMNHIYKQKNLISFFWIYNIFQAILAH